MKIRPVFPRTPVADDVLDTIEHFPDEGGAQAALRYIDALEQTYGHIGRYPATGSPRYAHELNRPDLRFRPLKRYPYAAFYVELRNHIDVWRVLHGQRDIPSWMRDTEEG